MNILKTKEKLIQLLEGRINDLEAQLVDLKCQASLANKEKKKKKRKVPKVERRGRLIIFPIKKQGN